MKIFDIATNSENEAVILPVTNSDFSIIKRSKQFDFNWSKLKGKAIYKLTKKGQTDILGLMYLENHGQGTDAVEIVLLEAGKDNKGRNKKTDRIAGCLIAFACKESIRLQHNGFVFLKPKTQLVKHYKTKYGFTDAGYNLYSDDSNSIKLINTYL